MDAIFLGVLLCVVYSQAADVARCSEGNDTTLAFTPYTDGVVGRYLAEWCINVNPKAPQPSSWSLWLKFFHTDYYCKHPPKVGVYSQGKVHSLYNEDIEVEGNCSHVCLKVPVDLVFNACYLLKSSFWVDGHERNITEKFIHINNSYTEEEFKNNNVMVNVIHHDSENVTIVWHTGVPFHGYDFELREKIEKYPDLLKVNLPTDCTAPSQTEVLCHMTLPPGEYHTLLHLYAPWRHGVFREQEYIAYPFNVTIPPVPTVEAAPAWPWAVGALVVVVILGTLARWACYTSEMRAIRKRVLWEWIGHRNELSPVPAVVKPLQRHILMLYAREGAAASRFCEALRNMLQEAPDTKVYDIFSPEVVAMAASGPQSWIRSMLLRSDVAILLVQTPALRALYQQQLQENDNAIRLQEPLLGRRVLYRAPQYGDNLLQYAVMLTAEAAHARSNYHKYYIATLSELPTEMFPQLVPYRRYLLPGSAALLTQNLCDITPSQHALNQLSVTAREFVDLTKDNPDYLMDELMFIS